MLLVEVCAILLAVGLFVLQIKRNEIGECETLFIMCFVVSAGIAHYVQKHIDWKGRYK